MILRLLLGDQLNSNHSWYKDDMDVLYFMAEMRQETDYTIHHIQKVIGFFLSMRNFNKNLKEKGCSTIYYTLDHPKNKQSLIQNLMRSLMRKRKSLFRKAVTRSIFITPQERERRLAVKLRPPLERAKT